MLQEVVGKWAINRWLMTMVQDVRLKLIHAQKSTILEALYLKPLKHNGPFAGPA